jgi:hypothetical protein
MSGKEFVGMLVAVGLLAGLPILARACGAP